MACNETIFTPSRLIWTRVKFIRHLINVLRKQCWMKQHFLRTCYICQAWSWVFACIMFLNAYNKCEVGFMFFVQIRKVRLREGLSLPKVTEWGQLWDWNKNSISSFLSKVTHCFLECRMIVRDGRWTDKERKNLIQGEIAVEENRGKGTLTFSA